MFIRIILEIMEASRDKASTALHIINTIQKMEQIVDNIRDRKTLVLHESEKLPFEPEVSADDIEQRKTFLESKTTRGFPYLIGEKAFDNLAALNSNIENYIGMVRVPTGVIGPLRIVGSSAQGDFYVPLATTEGARRSEERRVGKAGVSTCR